ncbi:LuxR C-terminal-related transcriptional regulator [Variovorax robiniae]|uniref:LuxR C-terminal-related transcriptional regulator n=1 Tax=Variovorax robiniae TaxID=1836199 RepID=A0ABU8XJG3_9BURK
MERSLLLLKLYRAAREMESGAFEENAIGALKNLLVFDSAIWGSGLLRPNGSVAPHIVHLHRQPQEAVQEWAKLNVADPVAAAIMERLGVPIRFHAPTLFAGVESSSMRAYAKRYDRQSYMVCGVNHALQPDFMGWLSLYRSDPDAHFTQAEQRAYGEMMSHLHEAQQINWRIQLHQAASPAACKEAQAITDAWGYMHTPWADVENLFALEWPRLHTGRLPDPLLRALTTEGHYNGRTIIVRSQTTQGLMFVRVRCRTALGELSPREQQIAAAIARGWSAKVVARDWGLSPATVRAHLNHIYDKLGLHTQSELAFLVGIEGQEPPPTRH